MFVKIAARNAHATGAKAVAYKAEGEEEGLWLVGEWVEWLVGNERKRGVRGVAGERRRGGGASYAFSLLHSSLPRSLPPSLIRSPCPTRVCRRRCSPSDPRPTPPPLR